MDRKGQTLGTLVIAFLALSGILIGISTFNNSIAENYNKTATNVSFTDVSPLNEITEGMYEKVNTGIALFDFIGWVWNAGLLAIRSFTGVTEVFTSFINFVSTRLGTPGWFISTISGIGAFMIIYLIAKALITKGGSGT